MDAFDSPCEIGRVGISPTGMAQLELKAVNRRFDWTWFLSADNLGREMLAIGLAAKLSKRQVNVVMTLPPLPADPSWTQIKSMVLI
jgi:hypothetical protein